MCEFGKPFLNSINSIKFISESRIVPYECYIMVYWIVSSPIIFLSFIHGPLNIDCLLGQTTIIDLNKEFELTENAID